ncbi:unnamed protein product, partial [Closterium sp. NIES-54]
LYLHWKIIGTDTLKVAVEAKSGTNVDNGWYGIGWSREGAMAPADAVLGNLAGGQVKAYMLGGYTKTGVQLSNRLALSNDRGTSTTGTGNTMFWPIDVEHFLHILIVRKEGIVLLLLPPHKLLIVTQGLFHIHLLLLILLPIVLVGSSCFDFTLLSFPPHFAISHSKLHALSGRLLLIDLQTSRAFGHSMS